MQMVPNIIILSIHQVFQAQNFLQALSSQKFYNLKTITIYFADWCLVNDEFQDSICTILKKFPKLKLFKAVVQDIKSQNSFKEMRQKFQVHVLKEWYIDEKW